MNHPEEEVLRLIALRQFDLLDTLPEPVLDDLTTLAAQICGTPISLISVVDERRQWFKSRCGLEATETSRELSFCAHAIQQRGMTIVPDATRDERFSQNPLVTGEENFRFYAGVPLITEEGYALGTLCVIDRMPRSLTSVQKEALEVLGRQAMAQLNLRRQARELARSERLLRTIFESEPACLKVLGSEGELQMINRAGLAVLEAESLEQVEGRCLFPQVVPEDLKAVVTLAELVFKGKSGTVEFGLIGLKGTRRQLEMHAAPLRDDAGSVTALVAVTRDITQQRQAEQALRRQAHLIDVSFDAIIVWDLDGGISFWNQGATELYGFTAVDASGRHTQELLQTEHPEGIAIFERQLMTSGSWTGELRQRTRDGRRIVVESRQQLVEESDGRKVVFETNRDITGRLRNEARFRRLVDSNVQGVIFWNTAGGIHGANEAFLRMVGYTREDLEANRLSWTAMTPPESDELDQHALAELQAKGVCTPYEKEFFHKNGTRVPVLIGGAAFEDTPTEGVSFVLDRTERKRLEQQILRAQRMDSIGTLAGGLAHDLNNVLGPIITSLELLKMQFPDPQSTDLLEIIGASAKRGAAMVKQVLSFARGAEGMRMEVHVRHLLHDIEKIANETFLKHIRIRTDIAPNLWPVRGDPTQLHQVFLNLCVNARDAMPEQGALTISAENIVLDAHYAGLDPESHPGPYVFIQIEDDGSGMSPEVLDQIFDPFFTTKEIGKGTGLGLSTSLGIVKSHDGFIRVYSEVGTGTTFKIYLPALTGGFAKPVVNVAADLPRGNGELILVVDDEAPVRQITKQTLEAFGYRVILACDGAEAVATYASRQAEIAVVLTDMMMPIMNGPATIQVLRKLNPELRIIAASGLSANGHVARAASLGIKHFLPKPYTAETLLQVLKQVLAAAP